MVDHENVIETKCFELLHQAIAQQVIDIHFVPDDEVYHIHFNVSQKLIKIGSFPPQLANRMILYYKFLSSLDISEKRKPQSGSFHKKFSSQNYSFRVSTIPSIYEKESVVIRIQHHNQVIPLDQLCMETTWHDKLKMAISMEQGLILLSGPTGSGKSTTLYTLSEYAARQLNRHIISIEDPVENQHQHLLQIQVNERAGITYSTGLKAILRHSPDIIVLGEIRDSETAKIAVSSALSGHLVLSTVHAKDTVGTAYRMLDFGVSFEELRQTLVCVTSQRLISKNDGSLASIFEIIDAVEIERLFEAMADGKPYTIPYEQKIQFFMQKYESIQTT